MAEWIFTLDNIANRAADFYRQFADRRVFAFYGQMGAGKTTFIHALCDVLQVEGVVSSPTFAIIHEYAGAGGSIYHMDLYRLTGEEDAVRAGIEDALYSGCPCLVEWPEKAIGLLPANALHVYLETVDEQTRRMRVADK